MNVENKHLHRTQRFILKSHNTHQGPKTWGGDKERREGKGRKQGGDKEWKQGEETIRGDKVRKVEEMMRSQGHERR